MAVNSDMLAAFVKVADSASVSRAALALGVGKSVVSKRVAQRGVDAGAHAAVGQPGPAGLPAPATGGGLSLSAGANPRQPAPPRPTAPRAR